MTLGSDDPYITDQYNLLYWRVPAICWRATDHALAVGATDTVVGLVKPAILGLLSATCRLVGGRLRNRGA